jgi:galactosamine-6-phosphate isomerase
MLHPTVLTDHESASQYAADWLCDVLRKRPNTLLCLASGNTPTRTYELLSQRASADPGLLAQSRIVKLDEWGGLPPGDVATCEYHLRTLLIGALQMGSRYVGFASNPDDPVAECARIAGWLRHHGPIDACVLGLGVNGHLGFNEPAEFLQPHAHVAELSAASLRHSMLSDTASRPTYGLTLGMADVLQSRRILVLATGAAKREPLAQMLNGRITPWSPASMLQLHPDVTLVCDDAAVSAGLCPGDDARDWQSNAPPARPQG